MKSTASAVSVRAIASKLAEVKTPPKVLAYKISRLPDMIKMVPATANTKGLRITQTVASNNRNQPRRELSSEPLTKSE